MKWLFNLIRSLICLVGFALYAYPVYLISPLGEGMSIDNLKILGVCWVLGMLSLLFSAKVHPKIDERKDFEGHNDYPHNK